MFELDAVVNSEPGQVLEPKKDVGDHSRFSSCERWIGLALQNTGNMAMATSLQLARKTFRGKASKNGYCLSNAFSFPKGMGQKIVCYSYGNTVIINLC